MRREHDVHICTEDHCIGTQELRMRYDVHRAAKSQPACQAGGLACQARPRPSMYRYAHAVYDYHICTRTNQAHFLFRIQLLK